MGFIYDIEYNANDLEMLDATFRMNNMSTVHVMRALVQSCDDMLIKCRWLGETIDCKRIFNATFSYYGVCCTFSVANRFVWSVIIFLLLGSNDVAVDERICFVFGKAWRWSSLHCWTFTHTLMCTQKAYGQSFMKRMSILRLPALKKYWQSAVSIFSNFPQWKLIVRMQWRSWRQRLAVAISKRNRNWGILLELGMTMWNIYYILTVRNINRYFRKYDDQNCQADCMFQYVFSLCKCLPYNFVTPQLTNALVCNFTQIQCLVDHYGGCSWWISTKYNWNLKLSSLLFADDIHSNLMKKMGNCSCPQNCEITQYDVASVRQRISPMPGCIIADDI